MAAVPGTITVKLPIYTKRADGTEVNLGTLEVPITITGGKP